MESTETPQQCGGVVNFFQGATIHNIVINGNMNRRGREHYRTTAHETKLTPQATPRQATHSDEQIAQAIEAICGEGKALDTKQKWAAVYWYLRWECNFPVKGSDFCERIGRLPFSRMPQPECDYNNIRRMLTMSFMNQDARQLESVKPGRSDEAAFMQLRTVVEALSRQLAG